MYNGLSQVHCIKPEGKIHQYTNDFSSGSITSFKRTNAIMSQSGRLVKDGFLCVYELDKLISTAHVLHTIKKVFNIFVIAY